MSAHLFPCPACKRDAVADDGHAICRECEGKPVQACANRAAAQQENEQLRAERDRLREEVQFVCERAERFEGDAIHWKRLTDQADARAETAEAERDKAIGARDSYRKLWCRVVAERNKLREELWEFWQAYHDEHCHYGEWPHPGRSCPYAPPDVLASATPAPVDEERRD